LRASRRPFRTTPCRPPKAERFAQALTADPAITHVMVVHGGTSSRILNPIETIAEIGRRRGQGLLVDALARFGAFAPDALAERLEEIGVSRMGRAA
jgi:2-aminoethylphosphonate-pyruvate transaminase